MVATAEQTAAANAVGAGEVPTKKQKLPDQPTLKFVKLSENAMTPTRGSALSAGYDLYRLVDSWNII